MKKDKLTKLILLLYVIAAIFFVIITASSCTAPNKTQCKLYQNKLNNKAILKQVSCKR